MPPDTDGGAEWRFVLDFYAREGVAPACLALQDGLGVDVTVLLHVVWLHCRDGATPGAAFIARLDERVEPWRSQATQPLRQLRRQLKTPPAQVAPSLVARMREHVAAAELLAEQGAFSLMSRLAPAAASRIGPDPVDAVLAHYAMRQGGPPQAGALAEAADTLRAAVRACREAPAPW